MSACGSRFCTIEQYTSDTLLDFGADAEVEVILYAFCQKIKSGEGLAEMHTEFLILVPLLARQLNINKDLHTFVSR